MKNFINDCSEIIPEILEAAAFIAVIAIIVIGGYALLTGQVPA